jgi:hypothetical protein
MSDEKDKNFLMNCSANRTSTLDLLKEANLIWTQKANDVDGKDLPHYVAVYCKPEDRERVFAVFQGK